jgi:hypothetical protein
LNDGGISIAKMIAYLFDSSSIYITNGRALVSDSIVMSNPTRRFDIPQKRQPNDTAVQDEINASLADCPSLARIYYIILRVFI